MSVRVTLPTHLRNLAQVSGEVEVDAAEPVTTRTILDALEERFPALRGTIRDHATRQRRAFIRFYVGAEDHSNADLDTPVPASVASGAEPFRIVGAMAGG